jgi:hypothetical protein
MGRVVTYYQKAKRRFFRGPLNMGAIIVPRFVGYQSVTLTALYWFGYFINTQLTLIGRVMILIGTLMISYCLLDPDVFPMSYLGFSLICLYVVNIIVGFIFRPKVNVKRYMPEVAICGATIPVSYEIKNISRLPCWDLKLDAIPYPGTSKEQLTSINVVKSGDTTKQTSLIKFKHRGIFRLPKVFAESSFPFGLWKWGVFGEGNREVKVLPCPISIDSMQLPFIGNESDHEEMQSLHGSGMEFASCREFRFGDNPKHIHWPSWARTGTPIVREMSNEGQPGISILFDNCYPVNLLNKYTDIQDEFELAVSFLAGVCNYMGKQKYCIRTLMIGEDLKEYSGNNPSEIYTSILNLCAEIEDQRKLCPLEMTDFAAGCVRSTKGLVMILLNLDESRKKLINNLNASGIPVKVFLLGGKQPEQQGNYSFISYANLENGMVGHL